MMISMKKIGVINNIPAQYHTHIEQNIVERNVNGLNKGGISVDHSAGWLYSIVLLLRMLCRFVKAVYLINRCRGAAYLGNHYRSGMVSKIAGFNQAHIVQQAKSNG